MSNRDNRFWYTIDQPRDRPCWEINPPLWEAFKLWSAAKRGFIPDRKAIYTEQYIVQFLDTESQDTQQESMHD